MLDIFNREKYVRLNEKEWEAVKQFIEDLKIENRSLTEKLNLRQQPKVTVNKNVELVKKNEELLKRLKGVENEYKELLEEKRKTEVLLKEALNTINNIRKEFAGFSAKDEFRNARKDLISIFA